ncbi:hypothetical protein D3C83_27170 [compost metagenome]
MLWDMSSISIARCVPEPMPAEPNVNLPGCERASAMNSLNDLAGRAGFATRMFGWSVTSETGMKSRCASKGSFL